MTWPVTHLTASGRTVVRCVEYGPIEVAPEDVLRTDGTLRIPDAVLNQYVTSDFIAGRLRITARGVSGIFALTEDITVQVRPRFPLTNLTHMVSVCGYLPTALAALREYRITDRWQDWMLDVVTDALLIGVDVIKEQGLLRTYRRRSDSSSYPHGRIAMAATINRFAARGIKHRATYSWFEKTADNPANRCIKTAAMVLHSRYRSRQVSGDVRARISRLGNVLRLFEEASEDRHNRCLNDSLVRGAAPLPEARLYYRPALDLAAAILSGDGLDLDATTGSLSAASLMVKTENLFEKFVRISLQRALAGHPELAVLDGNIGVDRRKLYVPLALDEAEALPTHRTVHVGNAPLATPDILFARPDGAFPLVADVKYTNVTHFADRHELEQVMLYGVRYESPVVLTVHPRRQNADRGLIIAGRIGDILVAQYRVDLAAADLDAEMAAMADSLVRLIAATSEQTITLQP